MKETVFGVLQKVRTLEEEIGVWNYIVDDLPYPNEDADEHDINGVSVRGATLRRIIDEIQKRVAVAETLLERLKNTEVQWHGESEKEDRVNNQEDGERSVDVVKKHGVSGARRSLKRRKVSEVNAAAASRSTGGHE